MLHDLELTVRRSETIGVVGPNGSGKTTLLRLMASLLRPVAGRAEVLGADLSTPEVYRIRHRIGMIGHLPALVPELTLEENLEHIVRLVGLDPTRVGPALAAVGLERASSRRADASSHGMQRRAEIAILLLRRPEVLLLDEALSGLDSDASGLVTVLIARTTAGGGAVVTVSHDRAHMEACDRVLTLAGGRLHS